MKTCQCGGTLDVSLSDDRVYCVVCYKTGYTTHFTGAYVCYKCGHMCECEEIVEG